MSKCLSNYEVTDIQSLTWKNNALCLFLAATEKNMSMF